MFVKLHTLGTLSDELLLQTTGMK